MLALVYLLILHIVSIVTGGEDILSINANAISVDWSDIWANNDKWETIDYLELYDGDRVITKCVDYFCLCRYHHKRKHDVQTKKLYNCHYDDNIAAKASNVIGINNYDNYEIYHYYDDGYYDYDMKGVELGFKPQPSGMPLYSGDELRKELYHFFNKYLEGDKSVVDAFFTEGAKLFQEIQKYDPTSKAPLVDAKNYYVNYHELTYLQLGLLHAYTERGDYASELRKAYRDKSRAKEIYFQDMLYNSATHLNSRLHLWKKYPLHLYIGLGFKIGPHDPITTDTGGIWYGPISATKNLEVATHTFGRGGTVLKLTIEKGTTDVAALDVDWISSHDEDEILLYDLDIKNHNLKWHSNPSK